MGLFCFIVGIVLATVAAVMLVFKSLNKEHDEYILAQRRLTQRLKYHAAMKQQKIDAVNRRLIDENFHS